MWSSTSKTVSRSNRAWGDVFSVIVSLSSSSCERSFSARLIRPSADIGAEHERDHRVHENAGEYERQLKEQGFVCLSGRVTRSAVVYLDDSLSGRYLDIAPSTGVTPLSRQTVLIPVLRAGFSVTTALVLKSRVSANVSWTARRKGLAGRRVTTSLTRTRRKLTFETELISQRIRAM